MLRNSKKVCTFGENNTKRIKMNKKRHTLAALLLALAWGGTAYAQTLNQAKEWFTEGKFAEAKPVFEKLVKRAPSNANYNFWYGACCFETGELAESQPYLEKSAARKVINAYLYLGKLYYTQYRFDDAVENLEEHISWLEKKKRDTEEAERVLSQCRMAARMLRGTERVTVVDSFVVDKASFLSAYKLSKASGSLEMTDNGEGAVYTNEWGDKTLFPQTDAEGKTHLYSRMKLIDRWSDPQPLQGVNQAEYSQNYPFLDSDGITLYYAAESEESVGGLDIFITRYDSDDNTYLRPDNIGMPFNSPANDYMYAIDEVNRLGWFASDRYQPEGKVCVYVFVPNESKEVYNYETSDPEDIIALASLKEIKKTQTSESTVRGAKQRLAQVTYAENTRQKKGDFRFIVDDNKVYHRLSDFASEEAREQFRSYLQKEKDLNELQTSLKNLRTAYHESNQAGKDQLTPGILDKEQRVKELQDEIAALETSVRNTELKKIKN